MLLSIAIPTYNGCVTLRRTIENTIGLIESNCLQHKVQIVISDNCSTDNTESVCFEFLNYSYFKYYKNKENIGYDRNVDNVVKCSQSDYVWLLSDDDSIMDGLVSIIKILEKEKPSYMFINYDNEINLNKQELYDKEYDINSFFKKEKFKNGLISSNIINTRLWMSFHMERYFDSNWIHFAYLTNVFIANDTNPLVIYYPKIITRLVSTDNSRENWGMGSNSIDIGVKLLKILDELKNTKANKAILKSSRNIIIGGYPKNILIFRARGFKVSKKTLADFKQLLPVYEYLLVWLYCHIPGIFFIQFLLQLKSKVKKWFCHG